MYELGNKMNSQSVILQGMVRRGMVRLGVTWQCEARQG